MNKAAVKQDLKALLQMVDQLFGIEAVLSEKAHPSDDLVRKYYDQSGMAYERIYSNEGCMHLAINPDGVFSHDGLRHQPRVIVRDLRENGGKRVLELGCGKGFNSEIVARNLRGVSVIGTDLLDDHVAKARLKAQAAGLANLSFEQASYEPLPDRFRDFDVIFGVETLCYAQDLDAVARSVAAALRPGGRFVIFDVHSRLDPARMTPDMAQASLLYAASMVVTRGFFRMGSWEAALARAGLDVAPTRNLTRAVQPGLLRLQNMALEVLGDWKKRLAIKALPRYLARNGVSALLGPMVYHLPDTNPDGPLRYEKIMATKPL